jgi:hypothetical protein
MTATEVQARLGRPAQVISKPPNTEYHYESCRGFYVVPDSAPAYTVDVGGIVVISGNRGVLSVSSPQRITEKIAWEWDYYNYSSDEGAIRTSSTPF